jgi:dolichol-phosphate mannosyltransferase
MSLIITTCITSGAIMFGTGILGEYVARIFEEIKNRPLYTVSLTANLNPRETRLDAHAGESVNRVRGW